MGRTYRRRRRKTVSKCSSNLHPCPYFINLTQWMKKHGWSPTCSLCPVEFYDTGRGFRAETSIPKNEVIVSIPLELLITVSTVEHSDIGWIFSKYGGLNGVYFFAQQVLAAFLVWERHLDHHSVWYPYLKSVPLDYSTPLFCLNEELKLLPPFLLEPILIQKQKVTDTFSDLKSILSAESWKCSHCSKSLSSIVCFEVYCWAWSAVNTRSVYVDEHVISHSLNIQDKSCLALAPYLDMFNHSNDVDVQVRLSSVRNCYEIQTLVPVAKHAQVFIRYGCHSNMKLYTEYGFILPFNPHDFIPFVVEEILTSVKEVFPVKFNCSASKLNFLEVHNLTENLSCNSEGLSFNMRALIYVFVTSESRKEVLTSRIYSSDFTSEESAAICNVGKQLIKQKCLEFETILNMMKQKKASGCSRSFEVAGDLILEYINLLRRSEKLESEEF